LNEDVVSFSLVWLFLLQCLDWHQCWLFQNVQLWYDISVQHCGGEVLDGGTQILCQVW